MAKTVNIDTPNPELPKEVQDAITLQNARETKNILMKQGVNILVYHTDRTARSTASTTYVEQESLRNTFASNGGLVDVIFKAVGRVNAQALLAELKIDGIQVDETAFESATVASGVIFLRYRAFLNAGNHVLNIAIKCNTGATVSLGTISTGETMPNTLWVTETIL